VTDPRDQLTARSDQLLGLLVDLHASEMRKRIETIGSPEFQRLAAKVEQLGASVYALTRTQATAGDQVAGGDASIDDIEMGSS
jgi:hypothetical protein